VEVFARCKNIMIYVPSIAYFQLVKNIILGFLISFI